ncbi:MAG: hypothetical protein Q9199_003818 [Rusavskia elegans]
MEALLRQTSAETGQIPRYRMRGSTSHHSQQTRSTDERKRGCHKGDYTFRIEVQANARNCRPEDKSRYSRNKDTGKKRKKRGGKKVRGKRNRVNKDNRKLQKKKTANDPQSSRRLTG